MFAAIALHVLAVTLWVGGMMFAWMYHRSNSIIPPITAHALNNGLAFLIFYFGPTALS